MAVRVDQLGFGFWGFECGIWVLGVSEIEQSKAKVAARIATTRDIVSMSLDGLRSRVLRFRNWNSGFQTSRLGFRVFGYECGVSDFRFGVTGSGSGVQGFGFRVSGSGLRDPDLGFRVPGFGFRGPCVPTPRDASPSRVRAFALP
jgi:hypothetical protein